MDMDAIFDLHGKPGLLGFNLTNLGMVSTAMVQPDQLATVNTVSTIFNLNSLNLTATAL